MIDAKTKEEIIKKYIESTNGRTTLASSLVNPIRRRLNYSSISRRILGLDEWKHYCAECNMQWNDDEYEHTQEDCDVFFIQES